MLTGKWAFQIWSFFWSDDGDWMLVLQEVSFLSSFFFLFFFFFFFPFGHYSFSLNFYYGNHDLSPLRFIDFAKCQNRSCGKEMLGKEALKTYLNVFTQSFGFDSDIA